MVPRFLPLAASACAVLLLAALPGSADVDPNTQEYSFIDTPGTGATVSGKTHFEGRAGDGAVTPNSLSEATPVASDPKGDGTYGHELAPSETDPYVEGIPEEGSYVRGPDIGNTWVTLDDGESFEIRMRLHEDPPPGNSSAATVQYAAHFEHSATGAEYRTTAFRDPSFGWDFRLWMEDADAVWCELEPLPRSGYSAATPVAGGILVFHVEYRMLDWTATPASGCVMPSKAPVTVPGVVLQDWYAWGHEMVAGVGIVHNSAGDTSDGPDAPYVLGPAAVPSGPYTVDLTVNGLDAGTVVTGGPPPIDAWAVDINLNSFPAAQCSYALVAQYGGASAMKVYRAADCDPDALRTQERPPATRAGDPNGSRTEPGPWEPPAESEDQDLDGIPDDRDECPGMADDGGNGTGCDPDLDGDGVLNGEDNCPETRNLGQEDKDEDGVGDACAPDADGDGIADPWDNCPEDWNELQVDLDGDGEGNVCDDDDDGDGVPDRRDDYPDRYDAWRDLDGDGIADPDDPDMDGDSFSNADELRAGTDPEDPDSMPLADDVAVHRIDPPQTAGVGLFASLGLVVLLAGVGVLLFFVIRPREDRP